MRNDRLVAQTAILEAAQLPQQINEIATEILVSTLHGLGLHPGSNPESALLPKAAPFYQRWVKTSLRYLQQRRSETPFGAPVIRQIFGARGSVAGLNGRRARISRPPSSYSKYV